MRNFFFKIYLQDILYGQKEEIAKIDQEIYSPRKSPDSPGGFGYYKEGKTNRATLSANS